MSNSLPNGWTVRYSACPMYDKDRQQTEFGIAPDIQASIGDSSTEDHIIETARQVLTK